MSAAPQLRSLYRRLLRELPLRPAPATKLSSPSPLQASIRASLSNGDADTDVRALEQFAAYARAQRTYLALVERYNPGMGMSEEERVRLTARRVGMEVPVEWRKGSA